MDIYLDDAGTGCILGKAVIVGIKGDKISFRYIEEKNESEVSFEILDELKVSNDDVIHVCRGNVFNKFSHEAIQKGYNIVREKIQNENQDIVENVFMNSLYELGLPRSVTLVEKEYHKLQDDIINEIFINPKLLKYVRTHFYKTKQFNFVHYMLNRLTNEFPHLYEKMILNKNA